ncbi:hypothetical protein O9X90_25750 [Agrobacterium leguminum]|uniref:hypothetical protein n=1 Tax=Agrobacterium leguminum TaxID=2792015 RepID=UPI0022B84949|nr:hypothetical protein [Agrobacterium leguminum]MCZ7935736.1 hypothetical protein [Agrobacterium leguminum]
MAGKKGPSGQKHPSAAVNDGGDGSSANSSAKRPTRSFSLPWQLVKQLDALPKGERSQLVEEALTRYFDIGKELAKAHSQMSEAAQYVFLNRDLLELRNDRMNERLGALEEQLVSTVEKLSSDVGYISGVIERLFHIRRNAVQLDVPSSKTFDEFMHEAGNEYLKNDDLLRPKVRGSEHDLEVAARMEAYNNRVAEATELLNAMPFMANPRFYTGFSMGGVGLFDKEHKFKDHFDRGREKDFEILMISCQYGRMSMMQSKTRPYCLFGVNDNRDYEIVRDIENLAQAVPTVVADYLAFMRLDGVVPKATS